MFNIWYCHDIDPQLIIIIIIRIISMIDHQPKERNTALSQIEMNKKLLAVEQADCDKYFIFLFVSCNNSIFVFFSTNVFQYSFYATFLYLFLVTLWYLFHVCNTLIFVSTGFNICFMWHFNICFNRQNICFNSNDICLNRQVQTGRADADLAKGFQGTIMEQQIRKYDHLLLIYLEFILNCHGTAN